MHASLNVSALSVSLGLIPVPWFDPVQATSVLLYPLIYTGEEAIFPDQWRPAPGLTAQNFVQLTVSLKMACRVVFAPLDGSLYRLEKIHDDPCIILLHPLSMGVGSSPP